MGSEFEAATAEGLMRSSKRAKVGLRIHFGPDLRATVRDVLAGGKVRVTLEYRGELERLLEAHGRMPLPPYIKRDAGQHSEDQERYQTVFAGQPGAVAAPTAGLHFTPALLEQVRQKGVDIVHVTLHVGYGTFAPVREADIRNHQIHQEFVTVSIEAAERINRAREAGNNVWPVGTTTVRSLEFAANDQGRLLPVEDWCGLYIYPGYRFKLVDRVITNFHLPQSSLLFLISALAGKETVFGAYQEAIDKGYRFFSYGDAMAIFDTKKTALRP